MKHHNILAGLAIGLSMFLAGCAAQGLAHADGVRNDMVIGTWKGQNGFVYEVEHGPGSSYTAHVTQTGGTEETLTVHLLVIEGQTFCQIPIGEGADGAPMYHFGLLAITPNLIQHRPVDEEWINTHTGSENGYIVCADQETMRTVLIAALEDRAFGPTDVLRREQ